MSSFSGGRPPTRFDRLLTRLAPARWRDSIAGDFEEDGAPPRLRSLRLVAILLRLHLADVRRNVLQTAPGRILAVELRQAVCSIRSRPASALLAVLTLALGIGTLTTVFSVSNWLLWRPLPGSHVDRLTTIRMERGEGALAVSAAEVRLILEESSAFEASTGWVAFDVHVAPPGHDVIRAAAEIVSPSFFEVIGLRPALGRGFHAGEASVVVVSHAFWQRQLDARADVIGTSLLVNGVPQTIVGVAPARFAGAIRSSDAALWAPLTSSSRFLPGFRGDPTSPRVRAFRGILARLKPDVTLGQAQAELDARKDGILSQLPNADRFRSGRYIAEPGQLATRFDRARLTRAFALLLGIAAFVLLITCANVGGLLLARASGRRTELATRQALGASRARIGLMLLLETALLTGGGTAVALFLAFTAGMVLEGTTLPGIGSLPPVRLDLNVFLAGAGTATLTAILASLAPILMAGRLNVAGSLCATGRVASARSPLRRALIGAQVALAVALLVGAALLTRSMQARRAIDAGLELDRTVTFSVDPGLQGYGPERAERFYPELRRRLAEIPGVTASALSQLPLFGTMRQGIGVRGQGAPATAEIDADFAQVTPGFFAAAGLPLIAGRDFREAAHDPARAWPDEAIVSESLARQLFGGGAAVGRFITLDAPEDAVVQIVGVARDARIRDFVEPAPSRLYVPFTISPFASAVLRAEGDSAGVIAAARQAVTSLDAGLPIYDAGTLRDATEREMAEESLIARLVLVFAGMAVLLAAVGLYGVVATDVVQRRREFGIRVALGATSRALVRSVTVQALHLGLAGTLAGLLLSLWLTGFVSARLYGVDRVDVVSLGAAALVALTVAVVAAANPARRASHIDPAVALRH